MRQTLQSRGPLGRSLEQVLPTSVQCWVEMPRPLCSCLTWSLSMACSQVNTWDWQLSAVEADPAEARWHELFIKFIVGIILLCQQHTSEPLSQELLSSFLQNLCDLPGSIALWMVLPCVPIISDF